MVTGSPSITLKIASKSPRCMGSSLASAASRSCFGIGQDHLAHRDDAVGVEEHVLGAAKPDAFGAEFARRGGVGGRVGIGAHLQGAHRIGPAHQGAEIAGQFRLAHLAPCP